MKFQNPSLNFILNGQTHGQAETNMLPTFSKWGGIKTYSCGRTVLAALETNTFSCGLMGLGAFETNIYSCGGISLAAFEVFTPTLVAGRHWWHLR